jgi:hypothetical protein
MLVAYTPAEIVSGLLKILLERSLFSDLIFYFFFLLSNLLSQYKISIILLIENFLKPEILRATYYFENRAVHVDVEGVGQNPLSLS